MTEKTTIEKGAKKTSVDLEAQIFNQDGKSIGKMTLPEEIFGLRYNSDLVHQVTKGIAGNKRQGSANTKGRGEVRGGGKKPWKQKGTGRARHGSSRSPIWVGGGVTHGPLAEKNYKRKITKSMRAQALFSVLSRKLKEGEIIFVDTLALKGMKTKDAVDVMNNISKATGYKEFANSKKPKILTALFGRNATAEKSFRNLPQNDIVFVKNLNPLDVLNHKYLLIENATETVKFLEGRG